MVARVRDLFTTVTTEGGLLPADMLQRIVDGDESVEALKAGLTAASFGYPGQRLNELINFAWNRLLGAWRAFEEGRERLPSDDLGTTLTRERWLLPLFMALDYGRLNTAQAAEIEGKSYAISHRDQTGTPIHLVSYRLELDKRAAGVAGAAAAAPHSLVQVFLNRRDEEVWGIVSNGLKLRLLRDNVSLTRQAYIEFDLEGMMQGEVYSDFVLLYLLCHQSRVVPQNGTQAECWLEQWMKAAQAAGTRALEDLRSGVERALIELGTGFIEEGANSELRDALASGSLTKQDYYRELLQVVYRLLFLFVAEDRELLLVGDATDEVRDRYYFYSTKRLRELAADLRGGRHHDLYEGVRLVMELLGGERAGSAALGLPVLGSLLFRRETVAYVGASRLSNRRLLAAVRALSTIEDKSVKKLRGVDFKNLGSEELGSVYESLLELHPQIELPARRFGLATAGGNERKTTGSYYTPTSLINALLDSALDPLLDECEQQETRQAQEEALLSLTVCDPACGSGHFLIAAANRMGKRLAAIRTGEEEPAPEATRKAKREVIAHCIYGVDVNPMAVALCKVNLWLESMVAGEPLPFLESRIRQGNSLLGTTPALMARGIPEETFPTKSGLIEGDDYKMVSKLRKRNRDERQARASGQLAFHFERKVDYQKLARAFHELDALPDNTPEAVRAKERRYQQMLSDDPEYAEKKFLADLWCAAFVWRKAEGATYGADDTPVPPPITDRDYRQIADEPLAAKHAPLHAYVGYLAARYDFFHWHVAFPDVFEVIEEGAGTSPARTAGESRDDVTGWTGGFSAVLGNPPWERIKLQEKEWFAERVPEIANAPRANERRKMIERLAASESRAERMIFNEFLEDKRQAAMESFFARSSERYPLSAAGDINTYQLFAGLFRQVLNEKGRAGIIVPSGIATDYYMQDFFGDLMQSRSLLQFMSFENEEFIFPTVHHAFKFCLMTIVGKSVETKKAVFVFYARQVPQVKELQRQFTLSAEELDLLNPNTHTVAVFRNRRDAELTKRIYRRVPVLITEKSPEMNPWSISFLSMFHATNDSDKFRTYEELEQEGFALEGNKFIRGEELYLPLYEAKMIHQFDHRFGTYEGQTQAQANQGKLPELTPDQHADPYLFSLPRYWVLQEHVLEKVGNDQQWLIGFRDITSPVVFRTSIFSIIPLSAASNKLPFWISEAIQGNFAACLYSCVNSFVFDFATRQKMGGNSLNFYIVKQLPVLPPQTYTPTLQAFITPRVLELSYTAWDLQPFAQDLGYDGPPFIWDEARRFQLRAELDALYFHLYGIARDDVDYIMETFPIVKRKDEAAHGSYRTKARILELYDQMAALPKMEVPAPKGEGVVEVPDVGELGIRN